MEVVNGRGTRYGDPDAGSLQHVVTSSQIEEDEKGIFWTHCHALSKVVRDAIAEADLDSVSLDLDRVAAVYLAFVDLN